MISIRRFKDFMVNESNQEDIIKDKLSIIESKLRKMFDDKDTNKDVSDAFKALDFGTIEYSTFSKTYKNLKLFFNDERFRYDVTFSIDIKDVTPQEGQEFDPETLKECNVVFVRYDLESGDGDDIKKDRLEKKVEIDSIDEKFFEECFEELTPIDTEEDEWELELEDDEEESEDSNK